MDREISFKAKRLDNGEWVEGYYVRLNGKHNRIYDGYAETDCGDYYPDWFEIDPQTICQYTGLTDKNGNKIWENDIVKNLADEVVYKCLWDSGNCEYMLDNESESLGLGYKCGNDIEVIGNIFDNPELLKGE